MTVEMILDAGRGLSSRSRKKGAAALMFCLGACSTESPEIPEAATGGGGGAPHTGDEAGSCPTEQTRFETGDPTGHADPYGASAAGQARAGRITDANMIVQPLHGRQRVRVGDYALANDKLAIVIEDVGLSDGYNRFGGEILSFDQAGADGRPRGLSKYVESLITFSNETIDASSVTVVNDGANGEAAVIRVTGALRAIPFLDGALGGLFFRHYNLQAAFDYVLEPGSAMLTLKVGLINPTEERIDFKEHGFSDERHGFFQSNHNQVFMGKTGFADSKDELPWVGFVSGEWNFAWRLAGGEKITPELERSGFHYMSGPGFALPPCAVTWNDHVELIGGGPHLDGLQRAIRRVDGQDPGRAITGTVKQSDGSAAAGAFIHATAKDGTYLTRTQTDANGQYTLHPGNDDAVLLSPPQMTGELSPTEVPRDLSTQDFTLPPRGTLRFATTDLDTGAELPVRIQVRAASGATQWPPEYGVRSPGRGLLHQTFTMDGKAELEVPAGEHQVTITRGWEWELFNESVTVDAGATLDITPKLARSVDSTGSMCADFHIHSQQSADSSDPVAWKVRGAVADGLEIPVSSEHEWVVDFQPVIEELGASDWAFGMPSSELTTFTWGHMGVLPINPNPDAVNNGAVEWVDKLPPEVFGNIRAMEEDPVLIINHPSGGGFGAYFNAARLETTPFKVRESHWSANFDAIEVFNDSDFESNRDGSVQDWFGLLNAGFTFWAVGSSDSHHMSRSPVGYPRTCIHFGHDDPKRLSRSIVKDRVAAGASTISGGLFMTVTGPGGAGPGQTLSQGTSSADFVVDVRAPSWVQADTLEIIVDGQTQEMVPLLPVGDGPGNRYVNPVTVNFDATAERSWVVFHARGDGDLEPLYGRPIFAVSNPVFYVP